jgi:hypothetical protein
MPLLAHALCPQTGRLDPSIRLFEIEIEIEVSMPERAQCTLAIGL